YKDTGTNPLASCLPLLLQMPIFLALFRTLNEAAHNKGVGFFERESFEPLVKTLAEGKIFGVVKISDSFTSADSWHVQLVAGVLVALMTITTFTTQRQLMRKNMPASALTGQYAQQQKILLYVLPVVFAVGGIAFPVGVLLYWTTSNIWTMGQQFYVIRNNPTPGTPAFDAKKARDTKRHPDTPAVPPGDTLVAEVDSPKPVIRAQPKKQTRSQRKRK
ncbi:MAG: membrane protein insertase YidC, partial [Actinomycetota bacterium]|nr:membrane protein insertase YidC [Actinomycetota bacterium]